MTKKTHLALGLLLCLLLCVCLLPAAYADSAGAETFAALKTAIANGESDFYMRDRGTVVFTESITIPATLTLHASGTEIEIPNGVTLTVESYCGVGTLTLQPGGHVTVSDVSSAHLAVRDALNYNSANQITVNGKMEIYAHIWRDDLKNVDLGARGQFGVTSKVYNDSQFKYALANIPRFSNEKFRAMIVIDYDCVLTDDLSVDDFALTLEAPGSLTIPAGKTLAFTNMILVKDAPIYLQGRMLSLNGPVDYKLDMERKEFPGALLNISGDGFFAGKEILVRGPKDQRDACITGQEMSKIINHNFTAYFAPIEVVLPDGLSVLGGEAFANDSFHTVYIPAGVTSIAPGAFSGTDVAIIFGTAGSIVERYANANGIPFLPHSSFYDVHQQHFVIDYQ